MVDELLDQAPCGFFSFRDDGAIDVTNATLDRMLGYERGALIGRPLDVLLPPGGRVFYQTHFFPLLKLQGRAEEIFLSLCSAAGETLPVLANAVRRERGGVPVNDCVVVPIHQRRRFEAELLQAKKDAEEATRAKDEFLAVVSHELRTPLNAILGWAKVLREGEVDEGMRQRALQTIDRNARAQAQLIEDILDYSRIISGKLRLQVSTVDLTAVIEAAVDVVRPAADARSIRIQVMLDPKSPAVSGDADRLQQVMWNLLSNAIKFTPKGGRVQVRLERVNSHVEVSVSDTGQGISAEFLPHVFERFRQADATSTRRTGGLGLGLSIVRHIVELHGGTISAQSPGLGGGSTFLVCLPVMILHDRPEARAGGDGAPGAGEPGAQALQLPGLEGLRILVVEDNADALELLRFVLSRHGATVFCSADASSALMQLGAVKPDLLLSDIEMPDEDGYSLIRKVRALPREQGGATPAIAITALASFSDRVRALSAGFQGHIPKPVDPAELILSVANLTARSLPSRPRQGPGCAGSAKRRRGGRGARRPGLAASLQSFG